LKENEKIAVNQMVVFVKKKKTVGQTKINK
jgi:hypothetical protein